MTTTHELARAIHPSKKPSFSPNLHRWMKDWAKRHPEHMLPEVWLENGGMKLMYVGRCAIDAVTAAERALNNQKNLSRNQMRQNC